MSATYILLQGKQQGLTRISQVLNRFDWVAVGAFALPMGLYLLTLAPTIYNLDSAELTTAVATGGIIRATGYPLYLVLGKLWVWIPVGDMGYRMNLFSAVCGATTIFLVERILRHLNVHLWARFGALGLLATAPYFWSLSLIAEVYTLHTALMTGAIFLLMHWAEQPTPLRLALPVFLVTISMGNHAATLLLLPGCVWYVVTSHPRQLWQPRVMAAAVAAVLFGTAVFLYLPLRYAANPVFNYAGIYDATGHFNPVNLGTLDGVLWLITGRTFSGQMFGYHPSELWPEVAHYLSQLWIAFFIIGIGPGLVGFVALLRRNWRFASTLTFIFLANAIFYVNYRVVDKDTMYLPTYVVWAIWTGLGFQLVFNWFRRETMPPVLLWLTRGIVIGAVITALSWNWSLVDLSDDYSTREQSEMILNMVEPDAIIFGWWDTVPGIQYLQLVEGYRPDVTAINRFLMSGQDMNQFILQEMGKRPIYINNPSIELLRMAKATSIGPLYHLEPLGSENTPTQN